MRREKKKIERFLSNELAELRVKHPAKRLMTSPKEIAEHTGLDPQVVRKSLSMMAGGESTKVVVIKVANTDVVIRLAAKEIR